MKRKYSKDKRENFGLENDSQKSGERGSAIIIALLVMVLLLGFVALAVTRTTNETIASSNDAAESRAFEAAHASLEIMTRNFDKIFELKLNPDPVDIQRVIDNEPPNFGTYYDFQQNIIQTQTTRQVVLDEGEFEGLSASQDEWQVNSTASDLSNGVEVALRRRFYNNRIPIFQFGIFYDDDLEFHPGPRFDFGGRVHSNGNLFMTAQTGLYFSSKVAAAKEIITDVGRNGYSWTNWGENVFIKNATGSYVRLAHNMGSVVKTPASGTPVFNNPAKPTHYNPDMPTLYENANWGYNRKLFQGNLLANEKTLDLPIKIASSINNTPLDYIELIKRGKNVGDLFNNGVSSDPVPVTAVDADSSITNKERYYNKTGIRISLADNKARLPGCASGVLQTPIAGDCGIILNGNSDGKTAIPGANGRGYIPKAMTGYQATRINGERFYASGREIWIKVEAVGINPATNLYEARDITEDILSMGLTEPPPNAGIDFRLDGYGDCSSSNANPDCRSVIKLQRFVMSGSLMPNNTFMTSKTINGINYSYVLSESTDLAEVDNGFVSDVIFHGKAATINNEIGRKVVAFPINMFDTREGLYNDDLNIGTNYPSGAVPWNGVMSMVDIDIANLKKFLDGDWNTRFPATTLFPAGLRSTDIPDANGWVVYISDRRGDVDFDGEYDMEDIFGNNDDTLQIGEDINENNVLDRDYFNFEAPKYTKNGVASAIMPWSTPNSFASPSIAAVLEHKFNRRGVRLINGQRLPGTYDAVTPGNTKGFTVASENGVYVQGNYNATGINSVGTPTPSSDYLPQNTAAHVPASVAADSVTILSNSWNDARSFTVPFSLGSRPATETFIRFAMLAGDARSTLNATPNQGGGNPRMTGGVHNFKRFLEDWSGTRLNYAGSLINLYNSHNNNGAFKCCTRVYSPPTRNWVFDTTFLDPNRLPPGTPFFQTIQLTGFERLN